MEQVLSVGREWSQRALFTLREMLPLMGPVATFPGFDDGQRYTLGLLLTAVARSSESVILLTAYGQLWDAEMVLRSVVEGTLKFAFLLESPTEFANRHTEFADSLFDLALLKDHQKAKDFLEGASDPDAPAWRPIRDRVLDDGEFQRIRGRYDKAQQRELEGRWGFTTLLNGLSKRRGAAFKELSGLAWSYSLMSHLQHADYIGVRLPMDRDTRSDDRRDSIHLAHHARLLNDALTAQLNRLTVGYMFVGADLGPIAAALEKVDGVRKSFGGAYERWMDIEYAAQPAPRTTEGTEDSK